MLMFFCFFFHHWCKTKLLGSSQTDRHTHCQTDKTEIVVHFDRLLISSFDISPLLWLVGRLCSLVIYLQSSIRSGRIISMLMTFQTCEVDNDPSAKPIHQDAPITIVWNFSATWIIFLEGTEGFSIMGRGSWGMQASGWWIDPKKSLSGSMLSLMIGLMLFPLAWAG